MSHKDEIARLRAEAEHLAERQAVPVLPVPSPPPNIIDFVTGKEWLNKPSLHPRQATMLKVIFLQDHLFTPFDMDVITEWTRDFTATGNRGIAPDVLRRIEMNKAEGRKWFREVDAVIGRRGGKGYLGALCSAYVLWHYLTVDWDHPDRANSFFGDPQGYYGIDPDKRLSVMVFGGKLAQAKAHQWRDLVLVLQSAPCFQPYLGRSLEESLTIKSPHDLIRDADAVKSGRKTGMDLSTFEIVPKESTAMAGRGPASCVQCYDEMAHLVNSGSNRSAEEVYQAATPALDQFGLDGFIFAGSSPWQKTGQYYENCQRALAVDELTGDPTYPEMLLIQLTSWDPYQNWNLTNLSGGMPTRAALSAVEGDHHYDPEYAYRFRAGLVPAVEAVEDVPTFQPLRSAPQEYDEQMRRLEMAAPQTFAVERRSHWAATMDAYLPEGRVDDIFGDYKGAALEMQSGGPLSTRYKMHGDPSKSGANFGLSIAHLEAAEDGWKHVVFDKLHAWKPEDFPEGTVALAEECGRR